MTLGSAVLLFLIVLIGIAAVICLPAEKENVVHRLYRTLISGRIGSRLLYRSDCSFCQRSTKPAACAITRT